MKILTKLPAALFVCGALSLSISAFAPFGSVADEPTSAAKGEVAATTMLKGNVVEVAVTLNNLRDARLSISRVRKAAANLYDEVTRQQMTMSYNPNIVGTTVIMTPSPQFSGQTLPARKKWVNEAMSEMGPIINLFKEDVDLAIESNRQNDVSDSTREALNPLRQDAFDRVKESFNSYKQLESLTAGGSYDNQSIAATVNTLDNQMKQLDKSLKKGISILQKDAKSSKKQKVASNS